MTHPDQRTQKIIDDLQERAKELNCLYRVDEILSRQDRPDAEIFHELLRAIPPGWKYPEICRAVLSLGGESWPSWESIDSPWKLSADGEPFPALCPSEPDGARLLAGQPQRGLDPIVRQGRRLGRRPGCADTRRPGYGAGTRLRGGTWHSRELACRRWIATRLERYDACSPRHPMPDRAFPSGEWCGT